MADILESDSPDVQLSKNEINNHPIPTTTDHGSNKDAQPSEYLEILTSSEQSDLVENGTSDNHDEPGLSSLSDNNNHSSSSRNPYHDFAGVDTESFITNTLRHNAKDRQLLLTLEKVFREFIRNNEQNSHQFQAMNSCKSIDFSSAQYFFFFI